MSTACPPTSDSFHAQTGDFNGDAVLDVVTADWDTTVRVLLSNGDGTFQSAVTSAPGVVFSAVGDFNADGKDDLVGASYEPPLNGGFGETYIRVMLSNGDGTFSSPFGASLGEEVGNLL